MERIRKYARTTATDVSTTVSRCELSLVDVFQHFMVYKQTQGLAQRTLEEYETHGRYLPHKSY